MFAGKVIAANIASTERRMKICRLFAATAFLMIACVGPAPAQDLTSEKRADIQKLLDMTGALAMAQQMANHMVAQVTQAIKARRPDIPQKVIDGLREEVNGVIRDNLAGLAELIVPIYHNYFTHEEIKGLIQFYSTELGQKAIRVLPSLAQDGMRVGQQWGRSLEPELDRRIKNRLKFEGVDLAGAGPERQSQPASLAWLHARAAVSQLRAAQ